VNYFPKDKKYIALFVETDEGTALRLTRIRDVLPVKLDYRDSDKDPTAVTSCSKLNALSVDVAIETYRKQLFGPHPFLLGALKCEKWRVR
jgi:hypothetical protein